ncbi:MAG: hypothetical protein H6922_01975 [Pseudomonadaceae bacterium]|nr:hypothetical protein [Pseudomonadaceae bacterium]
MHGDILVVLAAWAGVAIFCALTALVVTLFRYRALNPLAWQEKHVQRYARWAIGRLPISLTLFYPWSAVFVCVLLVVFGGIGGRLVMVGGGVVGLVLTYLGWQWLALVYAKNARVLGHLLANDAR